MIAHVNGRLRTPNFDQVEPYVSSLIRAKARKLKRRREFAGVDAADIAQDLWLHILERLPEFDPAKGPIETYVLVLVDRHTISMLRQRRAQKRDRSREEFSLDDVVLNGDGQDVRRESVLFHRGRERQRRTKETIDAVLGESPEHLKQAAQVLGHDNITDAARLLRIDKKKARACREALRVRFHDADLEKLL